MNRLLMSKNIYIDIDEELTAVIEKIKKVSTVRVFLVAPKRAHVLQSIVNLKILARQATILKKEIVLVTADAIGRNLAQRAGLLVQRHLNTKLAEPPAATGTDQPGREEPRALEVETTEKPPERKLNLRRLIGKIRRQPDQSRADHAAPKNKEKARTILPHRITLMPRVTRRLIVFVVAIAILFLVVLLFLILPQGQVTIQPKTQPASQNIEVVVFNGITSPDIASGAVPGEILSAEKEGNKQFTATGTAEKGQKAQGVLKLYNSYSSESQALVAGTRVADNAGHVFRILQGVTIPAAAVSGGEAVPGTVSAKIEADQPGEQYNVGPSRFKLPGLPAEKQSRIYGQSETVMSGGQTRIVKVVSEQNINDAVSQLTGELEQTALTALSEKTPAGKKFMAEIKETAVVKKETDKTAGAESDNLNLKLVINVKTIVFDEGAVQAMAIAKIEKAISEDKYLIGDAQNGLDFKLASLNLAAGKAVLAVAADKEVAFKINEKVIKENIAGKSQSGAEQYLGTLETVQAATVKLWPFWVKKVPQDPGKVKIKIDTENLP